MVAIGLLLIVGIAVAGIAIFAFRDTLTVGMVSFVVQLIAFGLLFILTIPPDVMESSSESLVIVCVIGLLWCIVPHQFEVFEVPILPVLFVSGAGTMFGIDAQTSSCASCILVLAGAAAFIDWYADDS